MKVVELYAFSTGTQRVVGEVRLTDNGNISLRDLPETLRKDMRKGVSGKGGKQYQTKDGIKFLRALKYQYSGSMLRASDVIERA